MRNLHPAPLIAIGLIAILIAELASVAVASVPEEADLVLVIAPPWHGGPEAIVLSAGGSIVGPTNAPLAVVATDAAPAAFKEAGAWFLLDPNKFPFLCATETPK
ncbi:hypothetical protein [Donghicola eburneus]|uniref:Putative membrane protein n=1 Tax=Donghicola eburneus TaxID=393278 RepID=A0A1M4MW29_9RHOB|nr:hypothetical protein [Donghicola eburneus]SCM66741.1 putative membrane protein [Donghicola eburneus]SFQ59578.1 hypothetical protein SAMN05421764_10717 [Donghicola eburneus]